MKTWIIAYKDKDLNGDVDIIKAPTYTMAMLEFMIMHPEYNVVGILEVIKSESIS